ncbi:MAG: oligoendopeptidase F family protein [Thermoanaerobaculales bacterium]|jgi:oligoendopeptidase F|nr:oligoendopeptidase F family protein [Thermoanaerobaculales bacterium]
MTATCSAVLLTLAVAASAGNLASLPDYSPDANAERSSIPAAYRWDLTVLFPDDAAWEAALEATRTALADLGRWHGSLAEPGPLADYMTRYFEAELAANRLSLYASLQKDGDTTSPLFIGRHQQALKLTAEVMDEGAVLRQAVLALDDAELEAAYADVPRLETFRPWIDGLRRRADRILEPEAERVLGLAGDNLWAAIDLNELPSPLESAFGALLAEMPLPMVSGPDGEPVQLTFANYGRLRAAEDRQVRRDAVEGMLEALRGFESTFAATLGGQAAFNVFLARARHYDTALEAYLDKDDLDPAVYRNLITTVRAHAPALHRYVELRKKVMGLDELHLYDLYVPMVEGAARDMTYAEGAQVIVDALAPLGDDYVARLAGLVDPRNGAVDVYPARTKDSGAFSASVYGVRPFIKMNYQDSYDDVSTLAHELGHAMHSSLSMANQPYLTSRYVPFLAEVASTANEVLLSKHMVANAGSDAERAWYLSELAETIRTTIYRQTMFAEFELALHELVEAGEPVTAERLDGIYAGLVRDYYGPGYTIGANDPVEWAYIPHFYYKYYVFTYATGLASGAAIAERVASGDPAARDAYLGMLAGGCSKPPLDLLAGAGVDLTRPDAIAAALDLFDRTLTELEGILLAR